MKLLPAVLAAEAAALALLSTPPRPDVAILRVFVSESGWESPADHHGILAVLERTGGGRSPEALLRGARRYAPRTFPIEEHPTGPESRTARQQWVNELDASCSMPRSLRGVSEKTWHYVYRRKCLALLSRVRQYLKGWRDPSCWSSTKPHHWGGAMDDHRAIKAMWAPVHVQCGNRASLNHFWCDPRKTGCYDETRSM